MFTLVRGTCTAYGVVHEGHTLLRGFGHDSLRCAAALGICDARTIHKNDLEDLTIAWLGVDSKRVTKPVRSTPSPCTCLLVRNGIPKASSESLQDLLSLTTRPLRNSSS